MVDHEDLSRRFDSGQLEAQLFLQRGVQRGRWVCVVGWAETRRNTAPLCVVRGPVELEVVSAGEPGSIQDWAIQARISRHEVDEISHAHVESAQGTHSSLEADSRQPFRIPLALCEFAPS